MVVSSTLKGLRKKRKMTLAELAKKSGVGTTTISVWERGKFVPTVDKFEKVLNALGYEIVVKEVKICDT